MMSICFATNNRHKIEEIGALLGPLFQLMSLQDIGCFEELPETQPTIEGNSLQKAQFVFERFGINCFADDTGLEVEALYGAPGVYSARYAGEHKNSEDNITLLLENLRNHGNRKARFKSVITLVTPGGVFPFEGIINGQIITERRGTMGFGYDSVFLPDGYSQTFAEMDLTQKNLISHRALAVKKLINFLRQSAHE
jgi:XTP/dITP diphosphohydrolase